MRILNAFGKPCSMEQGGARFNEFAGKNAGNLLRAICFGTFQVKIQSLVLKSVVFCCRLQIHEIVVKTFHKIFSFFHSENCEL